MTLDIRTMDVEGNPTLSNVLSWVSVACWLVVYTPQIIENYQLKSGEGLSVSFVLIWLVGDICSLNGALLAHLLPLVIILATYYTVCDAILLSQIYYYRWKKTAQTSIPALVSQASMHPDALEDTPLLGGNDVETKPPVLRDYARYAGALLFVFAMGLVAWTVDNQMHEGQTPSDSEEVVEWRSQALGWISAVMFLSARIPQIVKNFQTRCEGLSPFLFVYSITGNTTYVLALLAASTNMKHIMANASWIAGSTLTIVLDVFVLCQFFYYHTVAYRAIQLAE